MINKVQMLCECDDKQDPDIVCECDDKQGLDIVWMWQQTMSWYCVNDAKYHPYDV